MSGNTGGRHPVPQNALAQDPPRVQLVACSSTASQTQAVRNVLSELASKSSTASLVLPDGGSLGTLLQALPMQSQGINVTMGVALHETPIVSFVDHLFAMLETQGSLALGTRASLHAHPVMLHVMGPGKGRAQTGRAIHRLAKAHRAWVKPDDFEAHGGDWAEDLRHLTPLKGKVPRPPRGLVRMGQST